MTAQFKKFLLKAATFITFVQASFLLSLVYFFVVPFVWLLTRGRGGKPSGWRRWQYIGDTLEDLKQQF